MTKDYNSLLPSRENETSSSLFEGHKCLACVNCMSGSFLLAGRPSDLMKDILKPELGAFVD